MTMTSTASSYCRRNNAASFAVAVAVAVGTAAAAAAAASFSYLYSKRRNNQQQRNSDDGDGDGDVYEKHPAAAGATSIKNSILLTPEDSLFYKFDVAPITTLTWFQGNYEQAFLRLEQRMKLLVQKNPWLQGRISCKSWMKGTYHLTYHDFEESDNSNNLINIDENLTVVDPSDSPLSHEMSIETQNDTLLKSKIYLNDVFLRARPTQPLWRVTLIPCAGNPTKAFALVFQMSHSVGDGATYYKLMEMICGDGGKIEQLIPERLSDSKQQQIDAMGGLLEQSYLTSMGFMVQTLKGMILNSIRGPLQYKYKIYDLDSSDLTQISQIKKTYAAAQDNIGEDGDDAPSSYFKVSTNDILTSWLMKHTKCDYGLMAINWRNRLEGHTDVHVGNYENIILYRPEDHATPQLIRQSLRNPYYQRAVTHHQPFPSNWNMMNSKVCIVTNWSTFAKPNTIEGCLEVHHFPLILAEMVPTHTIRMLIIFRAGGGGSDNNSSSNNNNNNKKKIIGLCYPPDAMSCHNDDEGPLGGLTC